MKHFFKPMVTAACAILLITGCQKETVKVSSVSQPSSSVKQNTNEVSSLGESTMFVDNVTITPEAIPCSPGKAKSSGGWCWKYTSEEYAIVWIKNSNNAAVEGATVTGTWSGLNSGTVSGVTNAGGRVSFKGVNCKPNKFLTFTVTSVTSTNYIYDETLNVKSTFTKSCN